MADPEKFTPGYSYTVSVIPNFPGTRFDQDFMNLETSIDTIVEAIKDVRRSDGKLKNAIVTLDSLDPQVAAGVGAGALASAEAAAGSAIAANDSAEAAAESAGAALDRAAAAAGYATAALGYSSTALTYRNEAGTERTGAQTARDFANKWATEAEGVDVDDGVNPVGKSAYHWAQVALGAATGALPDNSVSTSKIVDGALSADSAGRGKMADGFVTSAKIADGTIATGNLADSAVTSAKIADGTIATGDLADGVLSANTTGRAKMADGFLTAVKAAADFVFGQAAKTTPVDTDALLISDSAASNIPKKLTFANLKVWIRSWIPFSSSYESAEQAIVSGGPITLTHGLGRKPSLISVSLICKTAEHGFSVGTELLWGFSQYSANNVTSRGISVWVDGTVVNVRYGSEPSVFLVAANGTGALAALTNANWRMVVRAWG